MDEENRPESQTGEAQELEGFSSMFPPSRVGPVSGLYEWRPKTTPHWLRWIRRVELRLDVDRDYPQMSASFTIHGFTSVRTHCIAKLTATGPNSWSGVFWYKDGHPSFFPHTGLEIKVTRSYFRYERWAKVTLSGGARRQQALIFRFKSPHFHRVDFEFDCAEDESATTSLYTCAHPNRPAILRCENLSIQQVFERAGFHVTTSPGDIVPLTGAGPNEEWSDQEMHDAMQTYWSRFASRAQWSMWVFFAALHEMGTGLGGIMFDDIGPNHRQGTAIFNDSFISNPPADGPDQDAWVQRMIFWTACHEMGHCFNLAHSWQKSLGTPWIPLHDEPDARSFMNYPFRVSGGETAFFADFEYRFSDGELLFMRHAPARFVQMGNADWFDHHGFQEVSVSPEPALALELRVNRERAVFEFMEPVTVELKLTNISSQPQLVDDNALSRTDSMTVILKKEGTAARQFFPYAQYCVLGKARTLIPDESVYESLSFSAGRNGWDIGGPGNYTVQVALQIDHEDIVSNALRIRVAPPLSYEEESLAQDFFSDDVGRIITFGGSRFLVNGNEILHEVAEKLSGRRVALHAALALGNEVAHEYKQLVEDPEEKRKRLGIKKQPAQPEEARKLLTGALVAQMALAVESFGHIDFKRHVDRLSDWLNKQGATEEAVKSQDVLYQTMSTRQVRGRKILSRVLEDIKERRGSYKGKK